MNYKWDGCTGEETILRIMTLGDLDELTGLIKSKGKEALKEVFLRNTHRFHGKNRAFWQVVLEVSDEEFEREAKRNFRNASKLKYFV